MNTMTDKPTKEPIYFYRANDSYGCFSNFSKHEIFIEGHIWPTSEHFYQAKKFISQEIQARIRKCVTPDEAAELGRSKNWPIKENWDEIKLSVMFVALMAKFTQHPQLRDILISTKGHELIEHTSNDKFWADGGDGTGLNQLGKLLCEIRDYHLIGISDV